MRILIFFLLTSVALINPALADPNCPPTHQTVCKQVIQLLNKYNDGGHLYKWDGQHLYIDSNFRSYDSINNNNLPSTRAAIYAETFNMDYFPEFLNNVVAATQNGQQAHLLFYSFVTHTYDSGTASNQLPSKVGANPVLQSKQVMLNSKEGSRGSTQSKQVAGGGSIKTPATPSPSAHPATNQIAKQNTINSRHRPSAISFQTASANHIGKQINKSNINAHFVTHKPGSYIEHNERAYMLDSENKVWSCKISGMGARVMVDQDETETTHGHFETLHFRSRHIMHIPANHSPLAGCLISVSK